jgi:hypothetical protein
MKRYQLMQVVVDPWRLRLERMRGNAGFVISSASARKP